LGASAQTRCSKKQQTEMERSGSRSRFEGFKKKLEPETYVEPRTRVEPEPEPIRLSLSQLLNQSLK